jgi:hypothetical protein
MTEEERRKLTECLSLEAQTRSKWFGMAPHKKVKCLYALASSFLDANAEEISEQLVLEAYEIMPEYASKHLEEDMKDEDFNYLCTRLALFFGENFSNLEKGVLYVRKSKK